MENPNRPTIKHMYLNESIDSRRWDLVNLRDDDMVVCTSLKSGTTWMLRILSLLVHQDPKADESVMNVPWPDAFFHGPAEDVIKGMDQIPHRRFIKTHIPLDGLPYSERIKYIQVTRDVRDAFFSWQNHWESMTEEHLAECDELREAIGDKPYPRFEDAGDVHQRWRDWITKGTFPWEQDGYPMWSMFSYVETFWPYRHLPNILMVHFTDMLEDLEGQMCRVAKFVGIDVPEEKWPALVEAATFDAMKKDLDTLDPEFMEIFKGGSQAFMDSVDGKWKEILNEEDLKLYEARASKLDPQLREWLEKGSLAVRYPDGKPGVKPE